MAYDEFWTVNPEAEGRAKAAAKPQEDLIAKVRRSLARLENTELEAIAQAAIELLDERSDPDDDYCQAGDDGCGAFFNGTGERYWGSDEEAGERLQLPEYGVDQREIVGRFGRSIRLD